MTFGFFAGAYSATYRRVHLATNQTQERTTHLEHQIFTQPTTFKLNKKRIFYLILVVRIFFVRKSISKTAIFKALILKISIL